LAAIGGDAIQVQGPTGLSVTQDIWTSTYQGMDADDYAASQWIGDLVSIHHRTVTGGIYS